MHQSTDSSDLEYHASQLVSAAQEFFDEVYLIDPMRVVLEFDRGKGAPKVIYEDRDISDLSVLMVRATYSVESCTRTIAATLYRCGCDIVDPLSRFSEMRASKVTSGFRLRNSSAGLDSYVAFDPAPAGSLLDRLWQRGVFPLVVKPVHGRQGIGIQIFESLENAQTYVAHHFAVNPGEPILLQRFVEFTREFRALIIHGHCLGIVEKHKSADTRFANAAQGAWFTPVEDASLVQFILSNINSQGLVGVDVAIDRENTYRIIEANRAPNWREIAGATGTDVSRSILVRVYLRAALQKARMLKRK